jgi:uncharacterized protein (DUF1499 family)
MKQMSGLVFLLCLGLVSCAAAGGPRLVDGRLSPCPDSPNCVCSEQSGSGLEPLSLGPDAGWDRLLRAITDLGGTIEQERDGYVHATFRSRVFGFVDDLECRRDGDLVHVRSAARSGWWDMGVNRRRVERLRAALSLAGQSR